MSGPVAGYVILPTDSGNTGKQIRTQTKVVGGQTVHEHFFVSGYQKVVLGRYATVSAEKAVQASADNGTTTGALWFHVPSAVSNKSARIRRAAITSGATAVTTMPTIPRVTMQRFTFTGTASGATLAATKIDSADPTAVADLRTANTGLTVTLVNGAGVGYGSAFIAQVLGASVAPLVSLPYDIVETVTTEDFWPVIAPGEGVVFFQDVAGTASDTRFYQIQLLWDEIDTA